LVKLIFTTLTVTHVDAPEIDYLFQLSTWFI